MQTAEEIRGYIKNIRYYANKVSSLTRQQFSLDYERGNKEGINTGPGSVRFECLGCIDAAATYINTYCDNIEANLKSAEEQDKKLWGENYTKEGEKE